MRASSTACVTRSYKASSCDQRSVEVRICLRRWNARSLVGCLVSTRSSREQRPLGCPTCRRKESLRARRDRPRSLRATSPSARSSGLRRGRSADSTRSRDRPPRSQSASSAGYSATARRSTSSAVLDWLSFVRRHRPASRRARDGARHRRPLEHHANRIRFASRITTALVFLLEALRPPARGSPELPSSVPASRSHANRAARAPALG